MMEKNPSVPAENKRKSGDGRDHLHWESEAPEQKKRKFGDRKKDMEWALQKEDYEAVKEENEEVKWVSDVGLKVENESEMGFLPLLKVKKNIGSFDEQPEGTGQSWLKVSTESVNVKDPRFVHCLAVPLDWKYLNKLRTFPFEFHIKEGSDCEALCKPNFNYADVHILRILDQVVEVCFPGEIYLLEERFVVPRTNLRPAVPVERYKRRRYTRVNQLVEVRSDCDWWVANLVAWDQEADLVMVQYLYNLERAVLRSWKVRPVFTDGEIL